MKIDTISRFNLGLIQKRVEDALKDLSAELGVAIEYGGGRYSNGETGEIKLKLTVAGPAGKTAGQVAWDRSCSYYGFLAMDFGRRFTTRGCTYEICGLAPSSHKYPILAKRADGKVFKFPLDTVRLALAIPSARAA